MRTLGALWAALKAKFEHVTSVLARTQVDSGSFVVRTSKGRLRCKVSAVPVIEQLLAGHAITRQFVVLHTQAWF